MKGPAPPFDDDAPPAPTRLWKQGDEPIPGYVLESPLGKGGFGEVWRCTAPGGFPKAVKIIASNQGDDGGPQLASQERQALELLRDIRHPFILTVERVEEAQGFLFIVMELADRNLQDLLQTYQNQGKTGIPRDELLGYLREAAEALDLMNFQHGLQHLDIKPTNLFLVSNHCKVADFGLVNRHSAQGKGQAPQGVTPRYVAPEVLKHHISRRSDQYSLAIVYQEMLTGEPPFKGRTGRQLFLHHLNSSPDLSVLSPGDRPLIARALSKEPEVRFASCADLIRLLQSAAQRVEQAPPPNDGQPPLTVPLKDMLPGGSPAPAPTTTVSLQGARYLDRIGQTPLGELWKVRIPTGEDKIAYHLQGFIQEDPAEQARALHRLRNVKHPALLRFEIAELTPARIILLFDPWGASLNERLRAKQINHDELLQDLSEAAHHLDDLVGLANLYHLSINPDTVIRGLDGVQLRDFGLVPLLWQSERKPLDQLNPRYAAPECAKGRPDATSDQYSLARLYTDMRLRILSGFDPTAGVSRAKKGVSSVELGNLPAPERLVLTQVLDHNPAKRFGTCSAMVDCLAASMSDSDAQSTATVRNIASAAQGSFLEALAEWVQTQPGGAKPEPDAAETLVTHSDGRVTHTCTVDVLPGTAKLRLQVFAQEWSAKSLSKRDGPMAYFIPMKQSFWQRLTGKVVGVEVVVEITPLPRPKGNQARATFAFRPVNCKADVAEEIRAKLAPAMVRTLRQCLNAKPERRTDGRVHFPHEVTVRQRVTGRAPVENRCQGINLSERGIGFLSSTALEKGEVRVLLSLPAGGGGATPVFLKALVTRCHPLPSGEFEMGAEFIQEVGATNGTAE
jgi:serine/threonine protein kinase